MRVVGILTARLILWSLSKLKTSRKRGGFSRNQPFSSREALVRRHRYCLSQRDNGFFVTDLIREGLQVLWRTWWWWWCWCAVKKNTSAQTLGKYTSITLTPSSVTDENHMEHKEKKQKTTWAGEIDRWLGTQMDWSGEKWNNSVSVEENGGEGLGLQPKSRQIYAKHLHSPHTLVH